MPAKKGEGKPEAPKATEQKKPAAPKPAAKKEQPAKKPAAPAAAAAAPAKPKKERKKPAPPAAAGAKKPAAAKPKKAAAKKPAAPAKKPAAPAKKPEAVKTKKNAAPPKDASAKKAAPPKKKAKKEVVKRPRIPKVPAAVRAQKAKDKAQKAKEKALKAASLIKKTVRTVSKPKVYYTTRFHRPHTQRLPKAPKYPRQSVPKANKMTQFRVLQHPLTTESAMKRIEDHNTLVFTVDIKASKSLIRQAVKKMYDIKASKIRTSITSRGSKKAYVKLIKDSDALDVASKIGII